MKFPSLLSQKAVWITLFCLLWAAALGTDSVPLLRGGFGWDWKYKPVLEINRLLPLVIGILVYIPVAVWLLRRQSTRALLAWAFTGGVLLTLAAAYVRGDVLYRLYAITISGRLGGWHMAATHISDLGATLRDWPTFMAQSVSFSTHMGISPPGQVIFYYAADRLLERLPSLSASLAQPLRPLLCQYTGGYSNAQYAAAWMGILMPVWASLTVVPLYLLGRLSFGREPASWSVVWWPLVPSFLSFAPVLNTFYPLPSVLMMLMLLTGLRRHQLGWVFAAGLLASVLTFLTFTFLPLLLFAGLLTLGLYWWKEPEAGAPARTWRWPLLAGLWFGIGLAVVWAIAYAASGLSLWSVWQEAQRAHLALDRPYWPWLGLHLNDFFMFTGWPISLLAGVGLLGAIREVRSGRKPSEHDIVILGAALTILLLDISGTLRGESGRILLFLSPWLLLAAAYALGGDYKLGVTLTALQGLMAVVLVMSLFVQRVEYKAHAAPVPPETTLPAPTSAPSHASDAQFGDEAVLQSYAGKVETQDGQPVMILWLSWKDLRPIDITYDVSIELVRQDGSVSQAAYRVAPMHDEYPTTCWKPDDPSLVDRIRIPLQAAEAGDWSARVSLVNHRTGEPLPVITSEGETAQQLLLGPFH